MECGDSDKRDVRRPMNAFLIFCKRHRTIVREKNPDLDNRSVTRILGDLWANLKDDEKSMYTNLAKQYKDAFMKANPDYKWHNPEKTVTPQKPTMPKPTNMKVLKNDMDLFSEGSIIPGKLADPSNMGGLSLLLIAGQQSDNQNVTLDSLNSDKNPDPQSIHIHTKTEQQNVGNTSDEPPPDKVPDLMITKETTRPDHYTANEYTEIKNKQPVVYQTEKSKEKCESGNEKTQSLLDLAEMCSNQLGDATQDSVNLVKNPPTCVKQDILDMSQDIETADKSHHNNDQNSSDISAKQIDEKENISKVRLDDSNKTKEMEEEESAMVTCGKLVVNHIIDKLYSSEIATAARKMSKPFKGPLTEKLVESIKTDGNDITTDLKQCESSDVVISRNSNSMQFDEPDGWKEKEVTSSTESVNHEMATDSVKQEDFVHKTVDGVEHCDNGSSFQDGMGSSFSSEMSTSKRRHLLSETGSTEGEDVEESQPVRKSRRRNRGQRYQELINEGIIQPSKERMAALQQPASKDEIIDEDFQSIDSYILPETAIRRIRKRTTSESAKDKMFHSEDGKRYKTGDFDLEAHIATLPACPIESMGRKRGFVRSRHSSETSHIRKQSAEESQVVPMFDTEKTVSLPPHVRLPSPQRNTEPVVGSRKRKARKHSITHLIPVPPSVRKNSTSGQSATSPQNTLDSHKPDDTKIPVTDNDTFNNSNHTSDISDIAGFKEKDLDKHDNKDTDNNEGDKGNQVSVVNLKTTTTDCDADDNDVPKNEDGCDIAVDSFEENKNSVGATENVNEKTENDTFKNVAANNDSETKENVKDERDQEMSEKFKQEADAGLGVGGESKVMSSETESQDDDLFSEVKCSGDIGAKNNMESVENIHKTVSETFVVQNKEASLVTETFMLGKPLERNCKSLQEVDSNIPRTGSDIINQNEAVETAKPKLQDGMDKIGTNAEKTDTDLNFNSTFTS